MAGAGVELVLSGTNAVFFPLHYADSFGELHKLVNHIEIPRECDCIRKKKSSPGHRPVHGKVAGSILGQGTFPGLKKSIFAQATVFFL